MLATFDYVNYKGVHEKRTVFPRRLVLESEHAIFHAGCYAIVAYCFERKAVRTFAIKDITNWKEERMPYAMLREYQAFVGREDDRPFDVQS